MERSSVHAIENEQQQPAQAFDSSLKELFQLDAKDILPELVEGVVYKKTLNVEVVRPVLRADEAYLVGYCEEDHILHVEFESGANERMPARLLAYSSILHLDHNLPVISVVVYLFRTTAIAQPPYCINGRKKTLVSFEYDILPLFEQDAERYVHEHKVCMYPLLPTMLNVSAKLIEQALSDLVVKYKENGQALSRRYGWMTLLLNRTDTISSLEKMQIKEVMDMYSRLWEDDPDIKRMRAESEAKGEAKGRAEGEAKGEVRALQRMLVKSVSARFSGLTELAEQEAARLDNPDTLERLIQNIIIAPDENSVRRLLRPSVA